MYKIDKDNNTVETVENKSFASLKYTERKHLQEWIDKTPSILNFDKKNNDNELLIIQKEFDGFDNTNERLDLLALDKQGRLVIIENKLDYSGRNVTWQALKYVSYCASFSTNQIIEIYQEYLDKYHFSENKDKNGATSRILAFLGKSSVDEIELNHGNSQRIILVAGDFPQEVTSTALWLLEQGIDLKCVKVTLFQHKDEHFLTAEQVIPVPEVEKYLIKMKDKDAEAEVKRKNKMVRERYWIKLLSYAQSENVELLRDTYPTQSNIISAGSIEKCTYDLIHNKNNLQVQFRIELDRDQNDALYRHLRNNEDEIMNAFSSDNELEINWYPTKDHNNMSKFQVLKKVGAFNEEDWGELVKWHIEKITALENAIKPHIESFCQS